MRVVVRLAAPVVLALTVTTSTVAAQPQAVAISTFGAEAGGTQVGTFVATGALADEGTYSFDLDSPRAFAFAGFGAPTFGIARSLEFLVGEQGSFTLQNVVKFTLTDTPGVASVVGTWAVVSGTGDYADLRGQGTITGIIDFSGTPETFAFEFTGSVHSD